MNQPSSSGSMDTRPPPPAYNRVVNKMTRGRSLRSVVMLCVLLAWIWVVVVGAANIRAMNRGGVSGKLMASYIIQAVLYFLIAALAFFGFYAAYTTKLRAVRLWVYATYLGTLILLAAQVVHIALHFVFKTDIKNACEYQEALDYTESTTQDIADWCDSDWRNDIWRQIAWLVFSLICAGLMIVLSRSFYHQMLDPNFGRTHQTGYAASHAYRLDGMNTQNLSMPYGGPAPNHLPPFSATSASADAPEYHAAPPMYAPPEKGSPYEPFGSNHQDNDRKDSMVDVRMEDQSNRSHDRDLASQMETLAHSSSRRSNDSEETIQGRKGEGRI